MAARHSSGIVVDQFADDLKQVRGIGPAVEKRLYQAGIIHYNQLAGMKPKKLASLLGDMVGFTEQRIVDQDWVGQARQLAAQETVLTEAGGGQASGEAQAEGQPLVALHLSTNGGNSHHRQHYAVFTIELLLDNDNRVRRTRAMHVQTQQEGVWAGWDETKMAGFIIQRAQLQLAPPVDKVEQAEKAVTALMEPVSLATEAEEKPVSDGVVPHGDPALWGVQLASLEGEKMGTSIPHGQSFRLQFNMDLDRVDVPAGERLSYEVSLFAKGVGQHERQLIGKDEGKALPTKSVELMILSQPLAPGDYMLETLVALWASSQPRRLQNQLTAITEGMLLHVY